MLLNKLICVVVVTCSQWCLTASQGEKSFVPPCDNIGINVQKCNLKHDNFMEKLLSGPDFPKALATLNQLAAPPYKNCAAVIPSHVDGKLSIRRTSDYCQWYTTDTNGKQQKNVFLTHELDILSYSCDYDATSLDIADGLQALLKNKALSVSITSCAIPDNIEDVQLDMPENFVECFQGLAQTGSLEKGSFGGSFQKVPVNLQFHVSDNVITVDKWYINGRDELPTTPTKDCGGDDGFKAICNCFQNSKMYNSAAQILVDTLLNCAKNHPDVVSVVENFVCNDN